MAAEIEPQSQMLSPFLSAARHEWAVTPGTGEYTPLVAAPSGSGGRSGRDERDEDPAAWRMKERMKTVSVALVLCLNIGTDPPDVVKTSPCARKECWVDPLQLPPQKALESVGKTLQLQYERWQPRARYKSTLDPTVDSVKKLCTSMRRNAKEERVLFHYNGHGVPRPTANGEVWVFNKSNPTSLVPSCAHPPRSQCARVNNSSTNPSTNTPTTQPMCQPASF